MVLIGSVGALFVWLIRLGLPESPRWLAQHGRLAEAEAVMQTIEAQGRAPRPAACRRPDLSAGVEEPAQARGRRSGSAPIAAAPS